MVNPLYNAYNMLRGFLSVLPEPILYLLYLIAACFVIVGIIQIIRSH